MSGLWLPQRPRPPVTPAGTPGISGLLTVVTTVVIVGVLSVARDVLIPITLAVLLSFVLAPLVGLLRRARLGRVPAVLVAVLLALGVILGVGGVIGAQVAGLAGDIPRFASTIQDKIQSVQGVTVGRLSALAGRMSRQIERSSHVAVPPSPAVGPKTDAPSPPAVKPLPVEVHQPDPSATELAQRVLAPILSPLATTGIVVVVAIFILLQREDLRDRLIRLFGARDLHRTMTAMDEAARRLSRYFLTQLALNTGFGVMVGLGLLLIGVPSPVLWGIVAVLMRFVPYVGSFLSALLPLALAAAVDPGWTMMAWTAALFVIGEGLMGQVVEPLVYGHSTGLSPLSVVIAAIFWGWLWGPVGLILSMPLTLCLVILGRHVDRLEFLDVLLGDRPALTPVESFYNRMLTGNLDEVQDDAEQMLKTGALSDYYDKVAVPGLQMAAVDIERGLLTDAQTARILAGAETLLDELSDHGDGDAASPDAVPAIWRDPQAVLCIAGRGPLDPAATAMLTQLLGKHGLGAHQQPHSSVSSRAAVAALDLAGVQMVCLIYASTTGTPAHLRYAVRRLRARLPSAAILVGLWPDDMLRDERLRAAIEADLYASTLRGAATACVAQALHEPAAGATA